MLASNFVLTLLCLWVAVKVNNSYLQPALQNRVRFRLYRLRDSLSLLAMRGELSEDSEEYATLISLINSSIRATGTFKVTEFLKFLFRLHYNTEMRERLDRIIEKIKSEKNPEFCRIAGEYFIVMQGLLRADTRVFRRIVVPSFALASEFFQAIGVRSRASSEVAHRDRTVRMIDNELTAYKSGFQGPCAI